MDPNDRHFAKGGSIFTAPGVKKDEPTESTKAQTGGLVAQALTGTGNANSATQDGNTEGNKVDAGVAVINAEPPKAQASAGAATATINQTTQQALTLGEKGAQQGQEIQTLTTERDAAAAEAEETPDASEAPEGGSEDTPVASANVISNPFGTPESDGTGTGENSAFSLSVGSADAPPPQETDGAGDRFGGPRVLAARRPGADDTTTDGATSPETEPKTAPTTTTEGSAVLKTLMVQAIQKLKKKLKL